LLANTDVSRLPTKSHKSPLNGIGEDSIHSDIGFLGLLAPIANRNEINQATSFIGCRKYVGMKATVRVCWKRLKHNQVVSRLNMLHTSALPEIRSIFPGVAGTSVIYSRSTSNTVRKGFWAPKVSIPPNRISSVMERHDACEYLLPCSVLQPAMLVLHVHQQKKRGRIVEKHT